LPQQWHGDPVATAQHEEQGSGIGDQGRIKSTEGRMKSSDPQADPYAWFFITIQEQE
jgi:hypothetical protein